MKKLLLVAALLLGLLALLNPGLDSHRQAVYNDLSGRFVTSPVALDAAGQADLRQTVEQKVYADNYLLFSLTKIRYTETSSKLERTVGAGALGKVFLWRGM